MILLTGGAGYVGRNVARVLTGPVTVVDDFRNSWRASAPAGASLLEGDLAAARPDWSKIRAVIHCAGCMDVAESVRDPALYWRNNVAAPAVFFREAGTARVVFSSTCQVYGEPEFLPVSEDHPTRPINPYGRTKLAAEELFAGLGLRLTALRYFNAAGGDQVHRHETHLIPRLLRSALTGETVPIYGDGHAIRDFVHVEDVARAHVAALERPGVFNLGSGRGASVVEVVEVARRVTGRPIPVRFEPPRPGDPRGLVADISRARRELGWEPRYGLREIVGSAWDWLRAHPDGYAANPPEGAGY
jgi:UDP-glucose 4-epimerase